MPKSVQFRAIVTSKEGIQKSSWHNGLMNQAVIYYEALCLEFGKKNVHMHYLIDGIHVG